MSWLADIRGRVPLWATIVFGALPIVVALVWWWSNTREKPFWKVLASQTLDLAGDKAAINAEESNTVDAIRLGLDAGELEAWNIRVTFERGEPFATDARLAFKDGARSHLIELPAAGAIRTVDFAYKGAARGQATVALNGRVSGVETRDISPNVLPSPGEVVDSIRGVEQPRRIIGITERKLGENTWASIRRVGIGFLIAVGIMLPLGVLMGSFNSVRATFNPVMTASGYVPIAALVPLTMSWFGIEEEQKIGFLAIAFSIFLLPMFVKAIDGVSDVYLRTARTLGASRFQLVTRVLFPIAGPDIWHALRLGFGVGWTYIVLTEAIVYDSGLGYLIEVSRRQRPREHIYLIIIIITVIAWIADIVWAQLGRLLFPYKRATA